MFMFLVRYVTVNAIIEKHLKSHIKVKNIADVLEMTAEDATHFFENIPKIKRKLQTLVDVGLGYVTLGQQATTLSGGKHNVLNSHQNCINALQDVPFTF